MATRMEKATCRGPVLAQRCRHMEERIRRQLQEVALAAMRKGEYDRFRVDSVSVSSTMLYLRGDRLAASAAVKLFAQAGTQPTMNEHCSGDGSFEACGMIEGRQ